MEHRGYDRRVERRRGKDSLLKIMSWLGLLGWFLMLVAFVVLDKAKPKQLENMMSGVDGHTTYLEFGWNDQLLRYVFGLMVLGFMISVIGLFINSMRNRRRSDYYRIHLIFLMIMSTIGIVYYLV